MAKNKLDRFLSISKYRHIIVTALMVAGAVRRAVFDSILKSTLPLQPL